MASVRSFTFLYLFLYICVVFVKADDCVTYNFENDVDSLFVSNEGVCVGITPWSVGTYSEIGLSSIDSGSSSFIYAPSTTLSCGSSFHFAIASEGIVEVKLYMDSNTTSDMITVMVIREQDGASMGNAMLLPDMDGFTAGWQTLRLTVISSDTSVGYLAILGMASEDSVLLVDSFRYVPPGMDESLCRIYSDNAALESTTLDTTQTPEDWTSTATQEIDDNTYTTPNNIDTTTQNTEYTSIYTEDDTTQTENDTNTTTQTNKDVETTTQQSEYVESCTTYNFESDYDVLFSSDHYLCDGFLPWQLDNYTSIGMESPDPQSTVFITPHDVTSCMSSFVFKMEPGGVVEANVFMDPVDALDHIIIIAQRVTGREYDTTAGSKMYHPQNQVFVRGWNVIRFSLVEVDSFDGYLIFIGMADSSSTVLVDSIRYIPPQTPPEDTSCNIY